jgi:hypothetical protein
VRQAGNRRPLRRDAFGGPEGPELTVTRARNWHWIFVGTLLAWPNAGVVAQAAPRVAVGPFAGVQLRSQQSPLFGIGATFPSRRQFAGVIAVSAVRDIGALQFEAGARWPGPQETLLTPYLGAAACLRLQPFAEQFVPTDTWDVGGVAFAGLEVHTLGLTAFVEGVGLTNGGGTYQVRGGLRVQGT